jgi:hypothetical protein
MKDFLKKFIPIIFIRVQCDREHPSSINFFFNIVLNININLINTLEKSFLH